MKRGPGRIEREAEGKKGQGQGQGQGKEKGQGNERKRKEKPRRAWLLLSRGNQPGSPVRGWPRAGYTGWILQGHALPGSARQP